jgi:hypothetical protein
MRFRYALAISLALSSQAFAQSAPVQITGGTLGNITNNVPTYLVAVSSGGSSICRQTNAAASTISAVCKASAGNIYSINVTASAATWFRIYNQTTLPTVGSGTPVFSCEALATAPCNMDIAPGMYLSGGIAITATAGAADNDTTTITTAATVHINIAYK